MQHRDFAEVRDIAGVVPLLLHPSRFLQGGESTAKTDRVKKYHSSKNMRDENTANIHISFKSPARRFEVLVVESF